MQASDLALPLPLVDRHTTALQAARLVAREQLTALVITDEHGRPTTVVPAVDVLGLLIPGFLRDDIRLAQVYDEKAAEELWLDAGRRMLADLLDDDDIHQTALLSIEPDATIVEVAARMSHAHVQIAVVRPEPEAVPLFVTMPALMDAILTLCGDGDGRPTA